MNLFLLGFVAQLVILYGMILFSDYLKTMGSSQSHFKVNAVKAKRSSLNRWR